METVSESWQVPLNKKTFGMLLMLLLGLLAPWSGFMFWPKVWGLGSSVGTYWDRAENWGWAKMLQESWQDGNIPLWASFFQGEGSSFSLPPSVGPCIVPASSDRAEHGARKGKPTSCPKTGRCSHGRPRMCKPCSPLFESLLQSTEEQSFPVDVLHITFWEGHWSRSETTETFQFSLKNLPVADNVMESFSLNTYKLG